MAQKARWFESLVLVDFRRYQYYQLPYATLENAKKQVDVAWASGNRRVLGRAQTIMGFVHLWRNELEEAERFLLNGLKDVEAVGDVDTQFINMALIGRKREDVRLTSEWAQRTLVLAEKAKNPFYRVSALGSLAWAVFRAGNEKQARVHLEEGLPLNTKLPSPLQFMILGPAMALEMRAENWGCSDRTCEGSVASQPAENA